MAANDRPETTELFRACAAGDVGALRNLLATAPELVQARDDRGATALHRALRHPDAMRLLLEYGADPNARDAADHATPLHFAAAEGLVDSVRLLLDAGADVHGYGDVHESGVIGWASRRGNEVVLDLLLARGARHHVFSAMALGDITLVEHVVREDPSMLARRRSRFENRQTALHASFARPDGLGVLPGRPDYAMLQRLIELGADVEATDDKGRTPLAMAMLYGDREAMRLLKAAGAVEPPVAAEPDLESRLGEAAKNVRRSTPMFTVPDMRATVRWYRSIGFVVSDLHEDEGELRFASLSLGSGGVAFGPGAEGPMQGASVWFFTDRIEELYAAIRERQFRAVMMEEDSLVPFEEDLYAPFYGGLQFSIRDPNGIALVFYQP